MRFQIVPFENNGGSQSFRVTGRKSNGDRIRENFADHSKALSRQQELENEYHGYQKDTSVRQVHTRLTSEQISDAEAALKILAGVPTLAGKTLVDAVGYLRDNYREPVTKMPLSCDNVEKPSALKQFLDTKRDNGCRPDSIRDLSGRIGAFAKLHPTKLVSDVTTVDIEAMIHGGKLAPQSRKNMRRVLFGFFKWCAKKGYCASNPVAQVETIKMDEHEPEALTLESVRKLLNAAATFKEGSNMPYFVLSLFCGIRPTEIGRLSWDKVNLEEKTITIDSKMAKMRQIRHVDISENAIEFLAPMALKRVPIRTQNWRKDHLKIKEIAGFGTPTEDKPDLKPWPSDVLRHTAISNHFAEHKHEGKTAEWAGNSPDVIHKHYRKLTTAKQAAELWAITPRALKRKVVKLKLAA